MQDFDIKSETAENVPASDAPSENREAAKETDPINERLPGVLLLGLLAFNYPILLLFNRTEHWFGAPLLLLYMFFMWLVTILLMALATNGNSGRNPLRRKTASEPPKNRTNPR